MRTFLKILLVVFIIGFLFSLILIVDYKIYLNNKDTSYCFNYPDSELSEERVDEHIKYVSEKRRDMTLIQSIFEKRRDININDINERVKSELSNRFIPEDTTVKIYLPNQIIDIKQGSECGVPFSIINKIDEQEFSWRIGLNDNFIMDKCGVSEKEAESWITSNAQGNTKLSRGDNFIGIIRLNIPEESVSDSSKCTIRYRVYVMEEDGTIYDTLPFGVHVI